MKLRNPRLLPVSQRDLADYLEISGTLMSMAQTGRHGGRQLSPAASNKMTELLMAHEEAQRLHPKSNSTRKIKDQQADEFRLHGERLLQNAIHAEAYAVVLKQRLDKMAGKHQDDLRWLNTVELLLGRLPKASKPTKLSRWLQNQHLVVLERLGKNGPLAQIKFETKIELEKAKRQVYQDMRKKLLKL
jgi:hypothetical protein